MMQYQFGRNGWRLLIISALALFQLAPGDVYGKTIGNADSDLHLPENLGEVVYQEYLNQGNRVYIIAQSHRSAINGNENGDCRQVQAEIYRIGEWLISNERVNTLLPEGYFRSGPSATGPELNRSSGKIRPSSNIDDATLTSLLSDRTAALSADHLLYDTYKLALHQVEDRKLYVAVIDLLRSLLSDSQWNQPDPLTAPLLLYQQRQRSAVILENINGALTEKGSEGVTPVHTSRAILTIGLSHVDTMIDLLNNGKTKISPPPEMEDRVKGYTCDLTELKKSCAIFVIIPHALKETRERLRQTSTSFSSASIRQKKGISSSAGG